MIPEVASFKEEGLVTPEKKESCKFVSPKGGIEPSSTTTLPKNEIIYPKNVGAQVTMDFI